MQEGAPIEGLSTRKRGRPPGPANAVRPPMRDAARENEFVRPTIKSESVREAEEYAAALIDSRGESIDETDEFYIDPAVIPEGWTYQWKRLTVAGKEDPHYAVSMKRAGWRAVQASRHPEQMPTGYEGPIEKKGLGLFELPKSLTDRAEQRHRVMSMEALRGSEQQLHATPPGTAPREEYPESRGKGVKRTIERAYIPAQSEEQAG